MVFDEIKRQIGLYQKDGKKIFSTSSMQSQSIVLLHIISRIDKSIPIYFLNTGYLFPETIIYKEMLEKLLDLNIQSIRPVVSKHNQKDSSGNLLFTSDPDYCCYLNKVQPMDAILAEYDIWINGVRADQSPLRNKMHITENTSHAAIRFHPLLDWTEKMVNEYIIEHQLPRHPLEEKGYISIGCEPCTQKALGGNSRNSRWVGLNKTECGLNTELVITNTDNT